MPTFYYQTWFMHFTHIMSRIGPKMNISTANSSWFSLRFQDLEFGDQAPQLGSPKGNWFPKQKKLLRLKSTSVRQLPYPRIHCSVRLVPTLRYAIQCTHGQDYQTTVFDGICGDMNCFSAAWGRVFLCNTGGIGQSSMLLCYPPQTWVTLSQPDLLCSMYYMVVAFQNLNRLCAVEICSLNIRSESTDSTD